MINRQHLLVALCTLFFSGTKAEGQGDHDCDVRSTGEAVLKEGQSYVENHGRGGYGDADGYGTLIRATYKSALVNEVAVNDAPRPPNTYLTNPIASAADILQAGKESDDLERKGQKALSDKIRKRIDEATASLYGQKPGPQALACIAVAERLHKNGADLENRSAWALAEKAYRAVVNIYQKEFGDSIFTANALGAAARACTQQNKLSDSDQLYVKALRIYEKTPKVADSESAGVIESYANFLDQHHQAAAAAKYFKLSSDIRRRAYAKH